MKILKLAPLLILLFTSQLFAQSYGTAKKVPFAFGFFPPVNTNGTNAGNCINQLSINVISGYSAGLIGFEFAGFSNSERDFVRGAQFSGFLNFVNGEFAGAQFAGFGNFNRGVARGFQFAGFSNFNYDEAYGMLFSGFANFTNGKSLAFQAAGFANFCEDVEGVQASGFANVVKGNGNVLQLAGFSNVTLGEVNGYQLAGFLNYSQKKMQKLQAAGFGNFSQDSIKGIQLAGFSNVANGDVNGVQIAGFLNVAKNVNGLQLGVVNIADSYESGIPVGVLSIVKNGFREFEVSAGEALNTQVAFKIGVDKFYNIFTAGTQFIGSDYAWAFGYGVGTHIVNNEQFKTQLELLSYHINEGERWTNTYNDLQQARFIFTKKINDHFGIFGGPTLNLMISKYQTNDGKLFHSNFAPYSIYSHTGRKATLDGWVGFTAGLHIN